MSARTLQNETTNAATPATATAVAAREVISYDPATGAEVGRAPLCSADEVRAAVARARAAQKSWAALSYAERGRVILAARRLVLAEMEEIAELVSRESGKPVAEAFAMEIVPTLDLMRYFARETARLLKPERLDIGQYALLGRSSRVVYKPLGVVAIISPW
ncbi:MAG TPA: aldehyde dehydrogenase family protein, partial [Pyrinomonadaceae bacterium]|nr:aldehyde dehydrogenase family protein [Pyrinomonadaceae bacterium]